MGEEQDFESRFSRGIKAVVPITALFTATISVAAWTHRFFDEQVRIEELWFYVLVPAVAWLALAGPLFLLRSDRRWLRAVATVLLVPASVLWALSILVGFYGLRIH